MKNFLVSAVVAGFVSTSAFAGPVGDVADYKLDRDSQRTSSMVKKGVFTLEVLDFAPDGENGPIYNTNIEYDVTIQFIGRKQGEKVIAAPEEFFGEDFIQKVREEGEVHYEQFKVRHMGYEDATNMDGASYPGCDKLFIYDIDTESAGALQPFKEIFAAASKINAEDIEDLELTALVTEGIPVLGAVKLDISGVARGISFKVGIDYLTP